MTGKILAYVIYYTAIGKIVNLGIMFAYCWKDRIPIYQQIAKRKNNETSGT